MKKIFYFLAIAAIVFTSCQEKNVPENKQESSAFTFKASIESLDTKGDPTPASSSSDMARATINGDYQLVWYDNNDPKERVVDHIGIYFPTLDPKNQDFILSDGAGTAEGEFSRVAEGDYNPTDATVAFFPWQGTGSDKNNVDNGTMKFKLPAAYWSYYNGQMLTPLIASITSSNNIQFKHAGAAVKFTVNNLATGTYKVKMSVYNKQITGNFHVNPANAGNDEEADSKLTLDAAENTSLNNITLNTWKGNGAFSWIFPVPELTNPKLKFEITDNNGILVWKKSLAAQSNSLSRADILVMPAQSITAYERFEQNDNWSFYCQLDGADFQDINMMTDGEYCIISGLTFKNGDKFKIRNKDRSVEYPAGEGIYETFTSSNAGTKDIIFRISDGNISVLDPSFPYPTVVIPTASVDITIDGDMSDWAAVKSGVSHATNNYREFKATYDKDSIYLYTKRVTVSDQDYMYYDFDLDNDPSTGATEGSRTGLEAYMALKIYGGEHGIGSINLNPVTAAKYPSSAVASNVVCKGTITTGAGGITETELSIPRSNLGIKNGDVIKIYSWGNKSADAFTSTPITLTIAN